MTDIEQWYLDQPEVESVKCEIVYYPESESYTVLMVKLQLVDDNVWNCNSYQTGGDFREDTEIMEKTAQSVFNRKFHPMPNVFLTPEYLDALHGIPPETRKLYLQGNFNYD